MKFFRHKILPCLLAFHLAVVSCGFTLYNHNCKMNGSSVSLFYASEEICSRAASQKKACCSFEAEEVFSKSVDTPCCHTESEYHKADFEGVSTGFIHFGFAAHFIFQPTANPVSCLAPLQQVLSKSSLFYFGDSSPPLTGRLLLVLYGQFLL